MAVVSSSGAFGEMRWETATRIVEPRLRPVVRRLMGYDERTPGPSERPELPGARVIVIVQTAEPIALGDVGRPQAFVAGLGPGATLTRHDGHQQGVQLDLDPAQARRVLGVPLSELAGVVVPLDDLLRPDESGFVDHVANAGTWDDKTAAVERWLGRRWARGRRPDPRIAGALELVERSEGRVEIGALGRAANLSRPHLARLFREHVGVTPKLYARLRRFEAVQQRVLGGEDSWAAVAADAGFSDQAHLAREVRSLAGCTPTVLAKLLGATISG